MCGIKQYFYLKKVDIKSGSELRNAWKIIGLVLLVYLVIDPSHAEAKRRFKNAPINYDITQGARYASLIVNSLTGEVLHKYNADVHRHPASLTKLMTVYITFQAIKSKKLSFNSQLPVSSWAALPTRSPTKLWLKAGQVISLRDALNGVIIHSANDASVVIAEAISGSEDAFAYKMTQTARQLGMKDTVFTNAHGLHDPQQVTTALDMAKLGIALRRDFPEFYPMFSKKSFIFRGSVINGHNRVLSRYRWADGLKTGYIAASGFNLVTSASRPEGVIVGVVLGGPSATARDNHMISLLDKGFGKLSDGKSNSQAYAVSSVTRYDPTITNAFEVASIDEEQAEATYYAQDAKPISAFDSLSNGSDQLKQFSSELTSLEKAKKNHSAGMNFGKEQVKQASKSKQQKAPIQKLGSTKKSKAIVAPSTSKKAVQASNKGRSSASLNARKVKLSLTRQKLVNKGL